MLKKNVLVNTSCNTKIGNKKKREAITYLSLMFTLIKT